MQDLLKRILPLDNNNELLLRKNEYLKKEVVKSASSNTEVEVNEFKQENQILKEEKHLMKVKVGKNEEMATPQQEIEDMKFKHSG